VFLRKFKFLGSIIDEPGIIKRFATHRMQLHRDRQREVKAQHGLHGKALKDGLNGVLVCTQLQAREFSSCVLPRFLERVPIGMCGRAKGARVCRRWARSLHWKSVLMNSSDRRVEFKPRHGKVGRAHFTSVVFVHRLKRTAHNNRYEGNSRRRGGAKRWKGARVFAP